MPDRRNWQVPLHPSGASGEVGCLSRTLPEDLLFGFSRNAQILCPTVDTNRVNY